MSTFSVLNKLETQTAIISLCSDHIVRVVFKKDKEINPEQVQENFDAYNKIIDGKLYAFIYMAEDTTVVYSYEGLNYSRQNSHKAFPKLCTAVVIESLAHRLIANFYSSIFNTMFPYRVFGNEEEAEEWCFQLIKKHHETTK